MKNPVIRFAYYYEGTPPKPVKNLKIADKRGGENSILMAWDALEDLNLKGYTIYASEKNIGAMQFNDVKDAVKHSAKNFEGTAVSLSSSESSDPEEGISRISLSLKDFEKISGKIMLNDMNFPSQCDYDVKKASCDYTIRQIDDKGRETGKMMKMSLEPGKGYVFADKQIVYVFKLPEDDDGKRLFFAVAGLSMNGLESEKAEALPAISIDDYPPPQCVNPSYFSEGNPPDEHLVFECDIESRAYDAESIIIEYSLTDTDDKSYLIEKPLSLVPHSGTSLHVKDDLPHITMLDLQGNVLKTASFRILTYQAKNAYQQEMRDKSYYDYDANPIIDISQDQLPLIDETSVQAEDGQPS